MAKNPVETWQTKAEVPRRIRDESVAKVQPPLSGIPDPLPLNCQGLPKLVLTPRELELTESYSVEQLLAQLRSRKLSSEELTRAFLRRAALAHVVTNCLTELLWDDAIERARYLDSLPEPIGPLHGLPISIKEHQGTLGKNKTSNASYVSYIGKPQGSTLLCDILWDAGCVHFARTTQPQAIMHLETESNIYGRTVNPYNRDVTPGGSSGGESALLGIRGSLFGVGGDIGGSIRVPAAHCGVYGFKPSAQRLPIAGGTGHMFGRECILATNAPITADRDSLELFMRVVVDAQPWRLEPSVRYQHWVPYKFTKPLKVAIQWWDGVVKPHPPMLRALREVADACKKAGIKEIISGLFYSDGIKEVLRLIRDTDKLLLLLIKFITKEQPNIKEYIGYTTIWNLLNYSRAIFLVTTINPENNIKDTSYKLYNIEDQFIYKLYNTE
ncbi:unnamed protein product [Clonostachys byssicola]|uniref:amidase n=1 Tax=Clonostachys byssicola TaxID=160290 RepID=A0A9N9Y849_9HYPO|nr:unnamed protein product [Clonostachys byssicola]